jgi:RHS repeat-associated protein
MVKENPNCGRDRSGKPTPRLHVCRIARIGGGLATDSPRPPKIRYQYAIADHQGNTRVLFSSVTPTPTTLTATFEGIGGDNSNLFSNVNPTFVVPHGSANNTPGGAKVVRMNQTYSTGPAKSLKVYPGDKVDMETYCYYESASGYGSTNSTVATMLASIASAFGGVSGRAGESGSIFNGINSALGQIGLAPNLGDGRPSAYLNYILFDQQYKVVDMGWTAVPSTASFAKQKISIPQITVKEAGYMFVYLSYETASNNWVYFDDFKVTQTKTNVLQYNEYYAYGLQTANSWTRENATGNNFLHNGGTELNTTTALYDLEYRNYDPVLARMTQVDPMASKYASLTPYNYSFNSPANFNDPDGADPIKKEPLPTDANFDRGTGWEVWHLPGMGGGGSRFGGGSYSSFSSFFSSAMSSSFGGSWSGGIGSLFENSDQAFKAGADYNFYHNSWGNTYYGSYEASYIGYAALKSTGELLSSGSVNTAIQIVRNREQSGLPTQVELERRFGDSFKDFIFNNFYKEFPGALGTPTRDYLERLNNWFGNQDWQYELKDLDKKHYLTLAEVRIKLFSQTSGPIDELRQSYLDYPPGGPRILNNERGTSDGTVFNPGIPGMQIIFLPLPNNYFIGIISEFNYIPHN